VLGRVRSRKEPTDRVRQYINEHLTEGTLSPGQIAEGAGISVRHLHRLFARRGTSVSEWIRVQRLEHCWKDLGDPRQRERSITEIAYFWGFNDSAHFSHSFKKHFGVSPRSYRLRHWVESREARGREEEIVYLESEKVAVARPS